MSARACKNYKEKKKIENVSIPVPGDVLALGNVVPKRIW
jgi:hypothetical protein